MTLEVVDLKDVVVEKPKASKAAKDPKPVTAHYTAVRDPKTLSEVLVNA